MASDLVLHCLLSLFVQVLWVNMEVDAFLFLDDLESVISEMETSLFDQAFDNGQTKQETQLVVDSEHETGT